MQCVASELYMKLLPLKALITRKGQQVPLALCIRFEGDKAFVFTGDVFGSVGLSDEIGSCAIDCSLFLTVLQKYADKDITITLSEDATHIVIRCGKSKTTLACEITVGLGLVMPSVDEQAWVPLPTNWNNAVQRCEGVVRGGTTDVLRSVHITSTWIEAASQEEVVRCYVPLQVTNEFCVIGGVLKSLLDVHSYQHIGTWLFLRSDTTLYAVVCRVTPWIDICDTLLHQEGEAITFPSELMQALQIAMPLVGADKKVCISLEGGRCTMTATTPAGMHSTECAMSSPKAVTFTVAAPLLYKVIESDLICKLYAKCLYLGGMPEFEQVISLDNVRCL